MRRTQFCALIMTERMYLLEEEICSHSLARPQARQMVEKDIGFVGEVTKVDAVLLESLVATDFIPVVSTVAVNRETGHALKVNADTAAGEIAAALQVRPLRTSERSVFLSTPLAVVRHCPAGALTEPCCASASLKGHVCVASCTAPHQNLGRNGDFC